MSQAIDDSCSPTHDILYVVSSGTFPERQSWGRNVLGLWFLARAGLWAI